MDTNPIIPQTTKHSTYKPGDLVLGRYVIEGVLGEGGMGTVFVAHHKELARKRYALKTLRPELFGYEDVEARFRREAHVLAALDHPGIVTITDYGMEGRTPVMVMELLQGETLRDRLTNQGPMSVQETLRVVREVAAALDFAHQTDPPVIHRDLKPENLFITRPDGRIKVLDFGIAKVLSTTATNITESRSPLGTPNYMSPEQLRDSSKVTRTTDTWALAAITYECLTTQKAFSGEGIAGLVFAVFDAERPLVTAIRPDVPSAVNDVLKRSWSLQQSDRYASASEFARAFALAASSGVNTSPEPMQNNFVGTNSYGNGFQSGLAPTAVEVHRKGRGGTVVSADDSREVESSSARESAEEIPLKPPTGRRTLVAGSIVFALAMVVTVYTLLSLRSQNSHRELHDAGHAITVTLNQDAPLVRGDVGPQLSEHSDAAVVVALTDTGASANGNTPSTMGLEPVFARLHRELLPVVRGCIPASVTARRVQIEVSWPGFPWLPRGVRFPRELPVSTHACISRAIVQRGQIPPQPRAVQHRFTFEL